MPYSLRTIAGIICDKNETINFMREKKLLAKNHSCCDQVCSQVKSKLSDGFEFHCKKCDRRYSISIRSFFFNVHMLLQNLLLMTYLFALKIPVKVCIDLMVGEVSHVSIKQWYNFLREVCSQHLFRHNNLLIVLMDNVTQELHNPEYSRVTNLVTNVTRSYSFYTMENNTKQIQLD